MRSQTPRIIAARNPRRSRSKKSLLHLALLSLALLAVIALATACGGSSDAATTTAPAGSATTAATTAATAAPATASPAELGEQIGTVYVNALRDVALLLKDKPEAAAVRSQVEQLKNDTVTKLVELGKAREAMSTSDRAQVDSKITKALDGAAGQDWYTTYNDVWTHYSSADIEFGNLIAAFNVIGQYANFDLLKKQLPDEATRLGIK
jgi:hypothetical protein